MKVIDTLWLTPTLGLVACENDMGERKFYIGKGAGFNEKSDSQFIADWGAKVDKKIFDKFFNRYS